MIMTILINCGTVGKRVFFTLLSQIFDYLGTWSISYSLGAGSILASLCVPRILNVVFFFGVIGLI